MNAKPTNIPDVYIIEPQIYRDNRGYFFEPYNIEKLQEYVGTFNIVQANQSKSKRGVLRGLHYQDPPYTQAKLVTVIKGEVLDVIVDIRTDSPTFGQHISIVLNGSNKLQLFVPKGFAHGFITLSKDAIFQYYIDAPYAPKYERGIKFNDPTLNIDWKIRRKIVNEKDNLLPEFNQCVFHIKEGYNKLYSDENTERS